MALLDVPAGRVRVAGEVVDVQLDRSGSRILHRTRVVRPALGGDAVEAGDHGNVDRGCRALDQAQVRTGAGVLLDADREVVHRLGEAVGGSLQESCGPRGLLSQLLLEQRMQDDRADAGVRQAPHAVNGVGERRR